MEKAQEILICDKVPTQGEDAFTNVNTKGIFRAQLMDY